MDKTGGERERESEREREREKERERYREMFQCYISSSAIAAAAIYRRLTALCNHENQGSRLALSGDGN